MSGRVVFEDLRERMVLRLEEADWPHRDLSRTVNAAGLAWHVQSTGKGPTLLLLHGTGASTHSWRHQLPVLAEHFTVIAPDLPGHGFSGRASRATLTLPGMARAVAGLLDVLDAGPVAIVGHSAGAAIAFWMVLEGLISPKRIISINGALLPFKGAVGPVFSTMARMLFANPLTPHFFAAQADQTAVSRVLEATGSALTQEDRDFYRRLLRDPQHVGAALGMMANWDLAPLGRLLHRIDIPVDLIVGDEDRAVPPADARLVANRLSKARVHHFPGLGHLVHEEDPATLNAHLLGVLTKP